MGTRGKTLFSKDTLLNMVTREVKHNQSKPGFAIVLLNESYFLKWHARNMPTHNTCNIRISTASDRTEQTQVHRAS